MLININKYRFIIIINSDIKEIFILLSLVNRKKFSIYKIKNIYNLILIYGNSLISKNKRINKEIDILLVLNQKYYKKVIFDII